jgi:integrase
MFTDTTEFSRYLRRLGMSPRTVALYARTLRGLDRRCRELGTSAAELDLPELDELLVALPTSRSSRMLHRSTLRHFWAYSGRIDPPVGAIIVPPKPRHHCRAMDEHAALVLERGARDAGYPKGLAVLLGLYAALRRAEICALRWDSIDADGWLTLTGKGGVRATIPLHQVLRDALVDDGPGEFVFPGLGGKGHVSPATVWNWTREIARAAGLAGVTPHVLRHTALATALDRNKDLRAVQDLARHRSPETTALYTRTTVRRLRAVVDAIDYQAAANESEVA